MTACVKSDCQTFQIKFGRIKNLREGSEVYYKNLSIGKVTDIELLSNSEVIVDVNLDKSFSLAKNDTFALVNFFGTQVIQIIPGKNKTEQYKKDDLITGVILNKELVIKLDTATKRIVRDSLIIPYIRK